MKILFCCTGNTCRSPMAEFIAINYLADSDIVGVQVESRGVMCGNGNPISDMSAKALAEIGITDMQHQSKMITVRELLEYDYIFVMTKYHKAYLTQEYNAGDNVYALGEFVGTDDISDPYGGSIDDYVDCRKKLEIAVIAALEKLNLKGV